MSQFYKYPLTPTQQKKLIKELFFFANRSFDSTWLHFVPHKPFSSKR